MQVIGDVKNLVLGGAKVYVMPENEWLELGLLRGQTALTVTTETVQVEQGAPRKLVANLVRKTGASLACECMDISVDVMSLATGLPLTSQEIEVNDHEVHHVTIVAGEEEGDPATAVLTDVPAGIDPTHEQVRCMQDFDGHMEPLAEVDVVWDDYATDHKVTLKEHTAGAWEGLTEITEVRLVHTAPGPEEISIGTNAEVPTLSGVCIVKYNAKTNKSTVVEMPFVQANGGLNLAYDNDANDVMAINIQLDAVSNPNNLDAAICTIREVNGEFVPGAN